MSGSELLVSGTRGNRYAVREATESWQDSFPIPGKLALEALTHGRDPIGSSLILI